MSIVLHLPWPPSVNSANGFGKRGYFPSKEKESFFKEAEGMFMTQKRSLMGYKVEGPFTYHLILNRDLRHPQADGDNRMKYPLDCAQKFGLIENDKFAEGGSWSWGPCQEGAMLFIKPWLAPELIERFTNKYTVSEDGCHLWTGNKSASGYGKYKFNGEQRGAHRVAWEMKHGPIPSGMMICHKCDVRNCVNVDHMFLGTHGENMRDMVRKGRGLIGELNGRSKLTPDQVTFILKSSDTTAALARQYGVSESAIRDVRKGRKWNQAAEHGAMLSIHPVVNRVPELQTEREDEKQYRR